MVWPALAAELVAGIVAWRGATGRVAAPSRALGAITLLAGLVVALLFAASIVERQEKFSRERHHPGMGSAEQPGPGATIASDLRPRIWALAAERFRDAPLLGHGFGREILAGDFVPLTPRNVNHPEVRHAHNAFVDSALELGVLGLAAFIGLFATLGVAYARLLRDARTAPLGIMGLALLAGFVVKNLTDDFFYRHNGLVFWAVNGMLLGLARPARTSPRPVPSAPR
jgi:O-antigen ligase